MTSRVPAVLRSGARPETSSPCTAPSVVPRPGCSCSSAGKGRWATPGQEGERAGSRDGGIRQQCLAHHRAPVAPLAAGPAAAAAGVTAMLDVSDGLLRDGSRIAAASGVRLDLSNAALAPDIEALATVVGEDAARECVLAGGEEHSLLATFPAARLPDGWRAIGTVSDGTGITLDGEQQQPRGWDHFRQGPDTDD